MPRTYNNIHEVMLSVCMANSELEKERYLHTGMMQYWLKELHGLEKAFVFARRARKMLMRDPWEFLGIAPC